MLGRERWLGSRPWQRKEARSEMGIQGIDNVCAGACVCCLLLLWGGVGWGKIGDRQGVLEYPGRRSRHTLLLYC